MDECLEPIVIFDTSIPYSWILHQIASMLTEYSVGIAIIIDANNSIIATWILY